MTAIDSDCVTDTELSVSFRFVFSNYAKVSFKAFDKYIEWYIEQAKESLRVLKDTGNLFFINYPKQNAYLRVKYLDGACYDVHEYVWVYNSNVGHSPKRFTGMQNII